MPHVSYNKLDDSLKEDLYRKFVRSLEKSFDSKNGLYFLGQFFTRTEREMFAKRFAVIVLLERQVLPSTISRALKMSRVTIDTMSLKHEAGKYEWVIKSTMGKKDFWKILDSISENLNTAGGLMPPRVGKGRWKKFYQ